MAYGGDLAIGSMAIITSICSIFIMPIFGLNQGAQPIIGFNYGAKNYSRVKKTYMYSLIGSTIILILSFIFIEAFPELAVGMFNKDAKLTDITISGMRIFLLSMPIIGVQMTASNYYQAVGKSTKAMIIGLTRQVIFLIPCFIILPKFFGLRGVWAAGPTADTLAVIVSLIAIILEMRNLKNSDTSDLKNSEDEIAVA